MEDLKPTIAKNIIELRKSMNLTQAELAQRMNYSDKAVSKWERAESVPDIAVLKEMADMFGVTVDYLLKPEHPKDAESPSSYTLHNRLIITLLSVTLVFLIATLLFAGYGIFLHPSAACGSSTFTPFPWRPSWLWCSTPSGAGAGVRPTASSSRYWFGACCFRFTCRSCMRTSG